MTFTLTNKDAWIFQYNQNNFRKMPDTDRQALKILIRDTEPIVFDSFQHKKYDDFLWNTVEKYGRSGYEKITYIYAKYLTFIDKSPRQLHIEIRNEILYRLYRPLVVRFEDGDEGNTDTDD